MNELDETTIRANLRRRAGGDPDPATLDRMTRSIAVRLREDNAEPVRWRRLSTAIPFRARVGVAAALILAAALIAVPFTGGPSPSEPPLGSASISGPSGAPTTASTPAPAGIQVLTLDELQRVVARGDQAAYARKVVLADVELVPRPASLTCAGADGCPIGRVAASDPPITVFLPAENLDLLGPSLPTPRTSGPLIVRIRGVNSLELAGVATVSADTDIVWSVPSFVRTADEMPRTMDLRPNQFLVGPAFVVDGKLASGVGLFCTFQTPSTEAIAEFACGVAGWLAPADVADPNAIIDGWTSPRTSGSPDWVRLQNGSYQEFAREDGSPSPPSDGAAVRGLYVVFPVLKYNATKCFECDAGAVAMLYARLEPVAIP